MMFMIFSTAELGMKPYVTHGYTPGDPRSTAARRHMALIGSTQASPFIQMVVEIKQPRKSQVLFLATIEEQA